MSSNIIIIERPNKPVQPKAPIGIATRNSVYYRMLKAGVSASAVKQKMIILGRVEKALAETLIHHLLALYEEEQPEYFVQHEDFEDFHTLKKDANIPPPPPVKTVKKEIKLEKTEVEKCVYFRMLKAGIAPEAVIQKMVVLEKINPKTANSTVTSYLSLLNPHHGEEERLIEEVGKLSITPAQFNTFLTMARSGVPAMAVKQKMIVLHKLSNDQADQLIHLINDKLNSSSNIILSENIIIDSPSDRPIFFGEENRTVPSVTHRYNAAPPINKSSSKTPPHRYDSYQIMIRVGVKPDQVKQRMCAVDKIDPAKADEIIHLIFEDILSSLPYPSPSTRTVSSLSGEKLYRRMVEVGVSREAVFQRMTVVDRLPLDVADSLITSC